MNSLPAFARRQQDDFASVGRLRSALSTLQSAFRRIILKAWTICSALGQHQWQDVIRACTYLMMAGDASK